jgi:hypothetical protein
LSESAIAALHLLPRGIARFTNKRYNMISMGKAGQSTGFAHHLKLKGNNARNKLRRALGHMQTWE